MSDRHQFRASWHDYYDGIYFVTVCCKDMELLLGRVEDGVITLSPAGHIVRTQIEELPSHFDDVEICSYSVMPNHIHLVIAINTKPVGTLFKASAFANNHSYGCLHPRKHDSPASQNFHFNSRLSIIMRCLKGGVTREAGRAGLQFAWQPRYHEHIIRTQDSLDRIISYVETNIDNWTVDKLYRGI